MINRINFENLMVFVVDDDEINNFLCLKVLENLHYVKEVKAFTNSTKTLDRLNEICNNNMDLLPDVILLDINMPYMDGWEFLEKLEKLKIEHQIWIPVAMLSSSVYQKDKLKSSKFKCVADYITKPLTEKQFENFILKIKSHKS
jgi:CheY-like chemotaxis protein